MFLFIFESIGTSELILIGIIALIFLGPRKLPEIARKMGKIMADFRNTTSEFKETWEREVNFEEEAKALRIDDIDEAPVPRATSSAEPEPAGISAPEIRQIDAGAFNGSGDAEQEDRDAVSVVAAEKENLDTSLSEKKDWL